MMKPLMAILTNFWNEWLRFVKPKIIRALWWLFDHTLVVFFKENDKPWRCRICNGPVDALHNCPVHGSDYLQLGGRDPNK